MPHAFVQPVSFGDCDPAGISFYPNTFRWMDACFHDWLRGAGGHAAICARLGAKGIGVIDAQARFLSPTRDGDRLQIALTPVEWAPRSLRLRYEGRVGDRRAIEAEELRGIFVSKDGRLGAGETAPLRAILCGAADAE